MLLIDKTIYQYSVNNKEETMEEEDEGQDDVTHCFFYKHTVYKHASLKIAYILSTS